MESNQDMEPDNLRLLNQSRISNQYYNFLSNYSWIIFGLICLVISYLVIWERGLYSDDYTFRVLAIDPVSEAVTPFLSIPNDHFPMRILAWLTTAKATAWLPEYEFGVRFLLAILVGVNSLLLGILVHRILKSKSAAVISGWLFVSPVFSSEAVLWLSTISYLISTGCAIAAIILVGSISGREQSRGKMLALAAVFFTVMMFSFEGAMTAIGIIILISFIAAYQKNKSVFDSVKSSVLNSALLVIVFGIIVFIFRQSPLISNRGGVDTNLSFLVDRSASFFERSYWLLFSGEWGLVLLGESFIRGYDGLVSSMWGLLLLFCALISLIITFLTWRENTLEISPRYRIGILFLLTGVLWTVFSILIPGIFSKGQIVEYRMFYFPTAGASLTIAAGFWLLAKALGFNQIFIRAAVGVTGIIVLLSSIIMLGYCQLFAERFEIDQKQLSAIKELLPPEKNLPPNTTLVLYKFDDNSNFKYPNQKTSNKLLFGVLESEWAATDALKVLFKRKDLTVITQNRWGSWNFKTNLPAADKQLEINGKPIDPYSTLFITYQNGKAYLINHLTLDSEDDSHQTIKFPLANNLQIQEGAVISIAEKAGDGK